MYKFFKRMHSSINQIPVDVFVCDNTITATKTSTPNIQVKAQGNFRLTDKLVKEEDFMLTMAAALEELCSGEVQKKSPYVTFRTNIKVSQEAQRQISKCLFRTGIGVLKFVNVEMGDDVEWKNPETLKLEA